MESQLRDGGIFRGLKAQRHQTKVGVRKSCVTATIGEIDRAVDRLAPRGWCQHHGEQECIPGPLQAATDAARPCKTPGLLGGGEVGLVSNHGEAFQKRVSFGESRDSPWDTVWFRLDPLRAT